METIRYYQRLRLVGRPDRRYGAPRCYSDDVIARLRFIKRAQTLGFTLREIALLVASGEKDSCAAIRSLAAGRLASIEKRLAELQAARDALQQLLGQCDAGTFQGCPILAFLCAPEGAQPGGSVSPDGRAARRLGALTP